LGGKCDGGVEEHVGEKGFCRRGGGRFGMQER